MQSVAPVIVGGCDRLDMDGDHLRGGDQLGAVLLIGRTQLVADLGRWLGQLDADAGQFGRKFEPFLRGVVLSEAS